MRNDVAYFALDTAADEVAALVRNFVGSTRLDVVSRARRLRQHERKEVSMSPKQMVTEATRGTGRPHQPGQAVFRAILPEEIDWKPFAAFPASVRLAVVVGQPLQDGPYTIRVKVPRGVKLMPHRHPEDRIYTVISGVFYIGLGDRVRRREVGGLSARRRDHSARQHIPLPLGEVR